MRTRHMKALLRFAAVLTIAIGILSLAGGCESTKTPAAQARSTGQPPSPVPAAAAPTAATPGPVVSTPAAAPAASPVIVPASSKSNVKKIRHTVEKGDTFAKIATKYHINKQDLADYNHMPLSAPLKAGSKIKIPPTKAK